MRLLIILFSFMPLTLSAFSKDTLRGKRYSSCDQLKAPVEIEYVVEFMPGNEEFEAEIFRRKSKASCKGAPLFAMGRVWKYEIIKDELITTLDKVRVILIDPSLIESFNKKAICGVKDWKIDEMVACEGKLLLDYEPVIGHRTFHHFKIIGKKLVVTQEDGETYDLLEF